MSAPTRRPRPRVGPVATTTLVLGLLLGPALTACSSDSDEGPDSPADTSGTDAPSSAATPAVTEVETTATVRRVTGALDEQAREQLKVKVTEVVDAWIDGAFAGGDYPRSDFDDAFSSFTPQARVRAHQDERLMSNALIGEQLDTVEVLHRRIKIDVLAPGGRASAVTVAVRLGLGLRGEIERDERIVGDLYLTFTSGGWQVFGYDVRRGEV